MKLFDLHCDTLYEMHKNEAGLYKNGLQISFDKAEILDEYSQIFAVWSDNKLSGDEAYHRFFEILEYAKREFGNLELDFPSERFRLSVEGGALLNGDLKRLRELKKCGVCILTLVWSDVCSVGGAHNTNEGLTDFGIDTVKACFDLGIIPDLSHASEKMFFQTADLAVNADMPIIATHSCTKQVCDHTRNVSKDQLCAIKDTGGIIGVNLVPTHLGGAGLDCVAKNLSVMTEVCGSDRVCLGCDFDGTAELPDGIVGIEDIGAVADTLRDAHFSEELISKIFYENARSFADNCLK